MIELRDLPRFWDKIDLGDGAGCWLWIGALHNNGYGRFRLSQPLNRPRKTGYAHRIMWFLAHGSPAQRFVCHDCQNPACVNPRHLREDDQFGNMQECVRLNRHGALKWRYLTPEQVAEIRACPTKLDAYRWSLKTGASNSVAYRVWGRKIYKDLP